MQRLTFLALTLLVIITSVLPTVLARETNADRLKRGYPPLPPGRRGPSRRDTAKRTGPSTVPTPQTVSGVVEVRDKAGSHRLGFISDQISSNVQGVPIVGVVDPYDQGSNHLPVNFSSSDYNLRPVFPQPYPPIPSPPCVGPGPGPDPLPLAIIQCPSHGPWSFDANTYELKITVPGLDGPTFAWDQSLNELEIVTTSTDDKQAIPVRLYLANSN